MRFVFLQGSLENPEIREKDQKHLKVMRVKTPFSSYGLLGGNLHRIEITGEAVPYSARLLESIPSDDGPSLKVLFPLIDSKRLEWGLEKLAEIGVAEVQFYYSDHSTYNKKQISKFNERIEKLENLVESARQQSFQWREVTLIQARKLDDLMDSFLQNGEGLVLSVHGNSAEPREFEKRWDWICIGPEGDFSQREIAMLQSLKCEVKKLPGKRILRSETALLYLASLQSSI